MELDPFTYYNSPLAPSFPDVSFLPQESKMELKRQSSWDQPNNLDNPVYKYEYFPPLPKPSSNWIHFDKTDTWEITGRSDSPHSRPIPLPKYNTFANSKIPSLRALIALTDNDPHILYLANTGIPLITRLIKLETPDALIRYLENNPKRFHIARVGSSLSRYFRKKNSRTQYPNEYKTFDKISKVLARIYDKVLRE